MSENLLAGIILSIALFASYWGVGKIILWATKNEILDIPGERSSHVVATPIGGGAIIVLVTLVGMMVVSMLMPHWVIPGITSYIIGSILIAVIGWMDDLYSIAAIWRFGVQAIVAIAIMSWVGVYSGIAIPGSDYISLGWLAYPLTFIWIVGLINAYNFMDGIDGNAGGIGVVTGIIWALIASYLNKPYLVMLSMLISVSCIGFLFYNWQPASIFMGDSGSTFLGFTFAVLPLLMSKISSEVSIPVVAVLVLAPCIWDATYTFLRRLWLREPAFTAHRTYLYQRLASSGYPHRLGASIYIVLSLLTGLCGLLYLVVSGMWKLLILVFVSLLLVAQLVIVRISEYRQKA